jgi:hypothetical protein
MMDIIQVLNLIIKAMVTIEKMVTLDGESKKNSVITYMKENLPEYDKYAHIIPIAIDLIVLLSRQKRVAINLKKYSCIS